MAPIPLFTTRKAVTVLNPLGIGLTDFTLLLLGAFFFDFRAKEITSEYKSSLLSFAFGSTVSVHEYYAQNQRFSESDYATEQLQLLRTEIMQEPAKTPWFPSIW